MGKDKATFIVIMIILFSFWNIEVNAANFYISNSGNDALNGTSPATAWKTISHVNLQTFNPGDSILFRCGDRWMEYLIIPSSGNSSQYITFSSYGTGAKPKLFGSIPTMSFTAHPGYSHVYRINNLIDFDLYYGIQNSSAMASLWFIIDGTIFWGDGRTNRKTGFEALSVNYDFYWRNDSVYFYYDGNIADIDTIEVPQLGRGIDVTQEYITIDGLHLRYFAGRCIGTSNYPEVTMHGFQMRNCELAYTASREDAVGYGLALGFSDMLIEHNIVHDNGRRNLSLNLVASTGNAVMRNVVVQDNTLYHGYHTTGVDISMHSPDQQIKNIVIRRNLVYDVYGGNGYESESIFFQNYENVAPTTSFDSLYVYNNLFLNTTLDAMYAEYTGTHIYFINNTCTGAGARAFIFSATPNQHFTIMNNIFLNTSASSMESIDGATDGTTVLDTCDYNLHYSNSNPAGSYIWYHMNGNYYYNQFDDIQALGYETHGLCMQAPCFVDSTSDWHLEPYSPAVRAGTPISFVTTDFEGNPRDPVTPDIGAYEYQGSSDIGNTESANISNYILNQNYPNPFNPVTILSFSIPSRAIVSLKIYDLLGREVAALINEEMPAGKHSKMWNAVNMAGGIYFYCLQVRQISGGQAGLFTNTKKLVLLR